MEYIISDTNIWIDFASIQKLHLPFLLPYTYIMSTDAIDDELLSPPILRDDLIRCGLVGVDIQRTFSLNHEGELSGDWILPNKHKSARKLA